MTTFNRQMKRLVTRPGDYVRFMASGQLPRTIRATGPLIDLLAALGARDRVAICGLTVDPALGYLGSRMFHTAEQALNWIRPHEVMIEGDPWSAESWRDKRFTKRLFLDDLLSKASSYLADVREALRDLDKGRPSALLWTAYTAAGHDELAQIHAPQELEIRQPRERLTGCG